MLGRISTRSIGAIISGSASFAGTESFVRSHVRVVVPLEMLGSTFHDQIRKQDAADQQPADLRDDARFKEGSMNHISGSRRRLMISSSAAAGTDRRTANPSPRSPRCCCRKTLARRGSVVIARRFREKTGLIIPREFKPFSTDDNRRPSKSPQARRLARDLPAFFGPVATGERR
jgi:hypothetical protein